MSERPWTVRRVAGGGGRRIPLLPIRFLFPYGFSHRMFRVWLAVIRSQPDERKAMRELLEVYADAYYGMDRGAIAYDDGIHDKHRLTRYHDFFVANVSAGERVLDIGCGKGELAHDLAERAGASVVAIDRARWALDFARAHFSHPAHEAGTETVNAQRSTFSGTVNSPETRFSSVSRNTEHPTSNAEHPTGPR